MRLYLKCPNCKILNKIYTESKEIKEDRIACKNCGRLYSVKEDPETGKFYLSPAEDPEAEINTDSEV